MHCSQLTKSTIAAEPKKHKKKKKKNAAPKRRRRNNFFPNSHYECTKNFNNSNLNIVLFGKMRSKIQYPYKAEETLLDQNPNNQTPRKKMHNHETQNFLLGWVLAIPFVILDSCIIIVTINMSYGIISMFQVFASST